MTRTYVSTSRTGELGLPYAALQRLSDLTGDSINFFVLENESSRSFSCDPPKEDDKVCVQLNVASPPINGNLYGYLRLGSSAKGLTLPEASDRAAWSVLASWVQDLCEEGRDLKPALSEFGSLLADILE